LTDGAMDWLWSGSRACPNPDRAEDIESSSGGWPDRRTTPSLRLLIDRFGRLRGTTDDAAHANQPALLALAKYPNVAVKNDRAPGNSSQPYLYRNIHKYIQQIYGKLAADVPGYQHHPHTVLVAAMRDDVH
jgi:hypothetical protein